MSAELCPEALLPAVCLAMCIQLIVAFHAVKRKAGARDLRRRLGTADGGPAGLEGARRRRLRRLRDLWGAGTLAVGSLSGAGGDGVPPTVLVCLAAIGSLLGWLAGQLIGLSVPARLLTGLCGAAAVVVWRGFGNRARLQILGPAVHSFLREVHLSVAAGETAGKALGHASERAADAIKPLVNQAWLAVQAGEDMTDAYGGLYLLCGLRSYQGFLYALWLHEQTGASLGELLGVILEQTDEELLARRELAARLGEARWTARVLAVVPVVLLGYMLFAQPDLVAPLAADPIGRQATAAGIALWLAGLGASAYIQRPPPGLRREL